MGILHPGITQSELVLRSDLGRRLTIAEMDGNFVYLEDMILGVSQSIVGGGGGTGSGAPGTSGTSGTSGIGIPAGGATGQILAKASGGNFDTVWVDNSGGGGGGNGTSGSSGISGTAGTSGTSGQNGSSGTSGTRGTSGTSGISANLESVRNIYSLGTYSFADLTATSYYLIAQNGTYSQNINNASLAVELPWDINFIGTTYSSGSFIYINSNSYVTFGSSSGASNSIAPGLVSVPALFLGSGDNSAQSITWGLDFDDPEFNTFRIRYEGSYDESGDGYLPTIEWEIILNYNTPDRLKVVFGTNLRNPGGVYGIGDGTNWVERFSPIPTYDEKKNVTYNAIDIYSYTTGYAEYSDSISSIKFVGPGVYRSLSGTTATVNIDPLGQFGIAVNYDTASPGTSVISSAKVDLRLTTGKDGGAVRIRPRGNVVLQPFNRNANQFGKGYDILLTASNASQDSTPTGNYDGGSIYITPGQGTGTGSKGSVYIGQAPYPWIFDPNTRDLTLPLGGDIKDSFGSSVLGGGGGGAGLIEYTYSQIASLISAEGLTPGAFYKITDFKTCYDQPDFDFFGSPTWSAASYKESSVSPLIVFAISGASFSADAWQPEFPKDRLKYDFSWNLTEVTGGTAYGRITERIDEFNNRTDYDHRTVLFKRYDWYAYDVSDLLAGTISFANGAVTGEGTTFTGLTAGQIIAIPDLTPQFYKIGSIESDTQMSLTGSIWDITGGPSQYYSIEYTMSSASYKRNNVEDEPYEMTTFGEAFDGARENYIGSNIDIYRFFMLSNNVFKDGRYENNTFGNNCFDNTFDDDCTENKIGNWFVGNITDDDFDGNHIADRFEGNVITANFYRNHVGESFYENKITIESFYRNRIGEGFENNKIAGNDFQNNVIGNAFNSNNISTDGDGFLKNSIGHGFNGNDIWSMFNSNSIGNGMNQNTFYSHVSENKIGDYFESNMIGRDIVNPAFEGNTIGNAFQQNAVNSDFVDNHILEDFNNNTIYSAFYKNEINNNFNYNTIGNSSDMGDVDFSQNRIGEGVKSNLFSGYTTNNEIGNDFYNNEIGNNFYFNSIGPGFLFNDIGSDFSGNHIGVFFAQNNILNGFAENSIKNTFLDNNISNNFAYNNIGSNFNNNTIASDFGFGGGQSRGNHIGNYFEHNQIGEYFYDNRVADLFSYNSIGDYFQLNDIKVPYLSYIDFNGSYRVIGSFSTNIGLTPSVPGTDGIYSNIGATGGSGHDATFDVTVSGSVVSSVVLNNAGYQYQTGDTLTIAYDLFGGTLGQDIEIILGTVSGIPSVYENYNTEIFKNSAGTSRLSYYDADDVLTIKDITL